MYDVKYKRRRCREISLQVHQFGHDRSLSGTLGADETEVVRLLERGFALLGAGARIPARVRRRRGLGMDQGYGSGRALFGAGRQVERQGVGRDHRGALRSDRRVPPRAGEARRHLAQTDGGRRRGGGEPRAGSTFIALRTSRRSRENNTSRSATASISSANRTPTSTSPSRRS